MTIATRLITTKDPLNKFIKPKIRIKIPRNIEDNFFLELFWFVLSSFEDEIIFTAADNFAFRIVFDAARCCK